MKHSRQILYKRTGTGLILSFIAIAEFGKKERINQCASFKSVAG